MLSMADGGSDAAKQAKPRRRRWGRRIALAVVGLGLAGVSGGVMVMGCSIPGPRASEKEMALMQRRSLMAEMPATTESAKKVQEQVVLAGNGNEGGREGGREAGNEKSVRTPSGLVLSYLQGGDSEGVRVIYVHGTPGDAMGWADFVKDPVPGTETIAVDRPGFGKSAGANGKEGKGGAVTSYAEQAAAIAPLLVERRGKWPILVGHSLGGPIVAQVAGMYPERVGGVVIVAGSLDPSLEKPGLGQKIASTGLVRAFLPRPLDNAMGELSAAKAEEEKLAALLPKVRCPVVIIHGTKDTLVPYENVPYIRRSLTHAPSVRVVTLEGQGHFVPWERPDTIREAVGGMVGGAVGGASGGGVSVGGVGAGGEGMGAGGAGGSGK